MQDRLGITPIHIYTEVDPDKWIYTTYVTPSSLDLSGMPGY